MIDSGLIFDSIPIVFQSFWLILIGLAVGNFVGAIPGFSAGNTLIVLLPFSLALDSSSALIFMISVYGAAECSNAFPAILFNTPGSGGALATTFDGYPMAKKGLAQRAISLSVVASSFGGVVSSICVLLATPFLIVIALNFGSIESFIVILIGVALIGQVAGENMFKGLLAGTFGLLMGAVGFDQIYDIPRATFGFLELYNGIPVIPVLVGMFAISEGLELINRQMIVSDQSSADKIKSNTFEESWIGVKIAINKWVAVIRSTIIGMGVGMIPGAGATIASLISYQQAKAFSKDKEKFGTGEPEGVIASEVANNAVIPGSLIPLFTIGLPGSTTGVVMLIVMQFHGVPIGPRLLLTKPELLYSVILAMLVGYALLPFISFPFARYFTQLSIVSTKILGPMLIALALLGSYAYRGYLFDMYLGIFFGFLGFVLKRAGYPPHSIILGIVLGPLAETYFMRGLRLSGGSLEIFYDSPLRLLLWVAFFVSTFWPLLSKWTKKAGKVNSSKDSRLSS